MDRVGSVSPLAILGLPVDPLTQQVPHIYTDRQVEGFNDWPDPFQGIIKGLHGE